MRRKIPEVDAYIEKAEEFARPILEKIRKAAHEASPEIHEAMKWGSPHFCRKGIVAGMMSFKQHVRFSFWRQKDMEDPEAFFANLEDRSEACALRLETPRDLPARPVLVRYFRQALELDEAGPKRRAGGGRRDPADIEVPADLAAGLAKKARARKTWEGFGYSKRKEYVEWLDEAKRETTRAKRLATTLEWLAEGKSRNWKYR